MPRSPFLTTLVCTLVCAATVIGCASKDAYRYETIKTEYADMACNLDQSQAADTPPATCAVNSDLTLQDVLDIAQANNPDLLMAVARIERARAMLEKSAAPFYPQVNVYTEYLQGDAPSAYLFKTIDSRKLPPDVNFNDPGWFENYESGVTAGINLFNGGRDGLNREMAKAALAEILGVEPDVPFGVVNAQPQAVNVPDDPFSALDYALMHRPELASIREQLRRSKMAVDASRAGYLPQLDFMTRYYANDPDMKYSTDRDNWTAGLYLNWKIFDGFATKSDRAEALSQLQETMAADRKTLLAVKFDVKRAYLNLNEAQERLKVTTSNVRTAKETFELVKRQYEGGSADITRYLEAELAYNRSRMSETAAYFDREKARAQIARAIGHWTGSLETGVTEG